MLKRNGRKVGFVRILAKTPANKQKIMADGADVWILWSCESFLKEVWLVRRENFGTSANLSQICLLL
jgi:hypothetical protein